MKMKNDELDQLFDNFQNEWDIQPPKSQHKKRFAEKLKTKRTKKRYFIAFATAASIALLFGLSIFNSGNGLKKTNDLQFASKETKQTDSIFSALIQNELIKIKDKKSPENEKIINDALLQMQALDSDYEKIKLELIANGENKQIIYAMISNLQTRISFLQNVMQHIENNEKLNTISDEKTM